MIPKLLLNKIHHGDCLKLFRLIPNESVDMVFADPPFNLKKHYKNYDDNKSEEDYLQWSKQWLTELVRVIKPTGAIFVHNIPKWLIHYAEILNKTAVFRNWIVWDAPTGCYFHGLRPTHYGILCYARNKKGFQFSKLRAPHLRERSSGLLQKNYGGYFPKAHPFGPVLSNVWTDIHRITNSKQRNNHPCQLPITLLERLMLLATEEGQVVLDPFMGTGTTAIAALRLGRSFIGFEQSKSYINIVKKNIKTRVHPSKIGGAYVSIHKGDVQTIRSKDWDELSRFYNLFEKPEDMKTTKLALKNPSLLDFATNHL